MVSQMSKVACFDNVPLRPLSPTALRFSRRYDPLADLVPHTDRFGRQFNASWTPLTGP